jgi:hypothetical protein
MPPIVLTKWNETRSFFFAGVKPLFNIFLWFLFGKAAAGKHDRFCIQPTTFDNCVPLFGSWHIGPWINRIKQQQQQQPPKVKKCPQQQQQQQQQQLICCREVERHESDGSIHTDTDSDAAAAASTAQQRQENNKVNKRVGERASSRRTIGDNSHTHTSVAWTNGLVLTAWHSVININIKANPIESSPNDMSW